MRREVATAAETAMVVVMVTAVETATAMGMEAETVPATVEVTGSAQEREWERTWVMPAMAWQLPPPRRTGA
jgi:hypothetical protein